MEWSHVRHLRKINNIKFDYNANGLRIIKRDASKSTKYYYVDGNLLAESQIVNNSFCGDEISCGEEIVQASKKIIEYYYGASGVTGFKVDGNVYYFLKNLQGDILNILNSSGDVISEYVYDAWGNHKVYAIENDQMIDITDDYSYNNIAHINPFRYRSYYFDVETGLYYLKSKYYDPKTGRFINADDIKNLELGQDSLNGLNLYMYCNNNPIMYTDHNGSNWLEDILIGLGAITIIGLSILTAGAIIAAAPAIAGFAGALAGSLGFASAAGAIATGVCIGAAALAISSLTIGVNEAIGFATGFNPIGSIIGESAYGIFSNTIAIAGIGTIMLGSMLPYPSTGRTIPKNLKEQLAMKSTRINPKLGLPLSKPMNDTRMPSWLGWQKYAQFNPFASGVGYDIHYVGNRWLKWFSIWFDFKIK
ncbi:MAG: RHS repeat-associated core domain-containing protein [Clostridia bacterium]|nr:RHS repeat-associated core domain-containing protein [Clostridia bacterium]